MALTKITGEGIGTTSGDLTVDVAGDIILDADGGDVTIKDGGTSIGAITNTSSDLSIYSTASGHSGIRFHENGILPTNNAGALVDNDAVLGDASYRYTNLFLSGGVYLGGTGSANLLDDYEEGTFTPAINSGATGGSYANTSGNYTKIGNMVTFTIRLQPGSFTGNGDGFNLSGLPFTSATGVREGGGFFNYLGNFEDPMPTIHIGAGNTLISFFTQSGSGLVGNTINNLNVTIHIQGFYYTG